jgi:hypothetical protein
MQSAEDTHSVHGIDEAFADAAYSTIVLAFTGDPAARWSWPRPDDYLRNMPLAARAFSSKAFASGTAYEIGRFAGVALWLPPGISSDGEALESLMARNRQKLKAALEVRMSIFSYPFGSC